MVRMSLLCNLASCLDGVFSLILILFTLQDSVSPFITMLQNIPFEGV